MNNEELRLTLLLWFTVMKQVSGRKFPSVTQSPELGRTTAECRSHALLHHFQESPSSHRPSVLPSHLGMSLCTVFGLVSYVVENLFFSSLSSTPCS